MPRRLSTRGRGAFSRFAANDPDPRSELQYVNPYMLLVAVVLSAQATDKGVNKATTPLFALIDTPDKMVAFGEERLREAIKTIGLYRTKAKNVIALSKTLIEKYGGDVPRDLDALQELPGVGRKTANVVMNVAFGQPTIAVDTHIFRVGNRTGLAPGKAPRDVEDNLEAVVPEKYKLHAHHWLILHGRYICVARSRVVRLHRRRSCRFTPKDGARGSNAPGREARSCAKRSQRRRGLGRGRVGGRHDQAPKTIGIGGHVLATRARLRMADAIGATLGVEEEKRRAAHTVIAPQLGIGLAPDKGGRSVGSA